MTQCNGSSRDYNAMRGLVPWRASLPDDVLWHRPAHVWWDDWWRWRVLREAITAALPGEEA